VIQHLDGKWNLWDEDKQQPQKESYGVYSTNPVLKNITDYLIEEASAEEEELLGLTSSDGEFDGEGKEDKANTIER
jgi:major membrane immunogen (membrane-anchored lipoprotein)